MLFRFSLLLFFCNLAHINADERGQEIRIINGKEVTDPYKYADGRRHRRTTKVIGAPGKKSPPKGTKKTKTTKGNNGTKKKTAAPTASPTESPTPVECPEHLNPAPPGKKWALIDDVDSKPSSKPSGKPTASSKPSGKPTAEHTSERPSNSDPNESPTDSPTLRNVALDGTASQSSGIKQCDCKASKAINGNTSGNCQTQQCSHTANQHQPWWKVDLHFFYSINTIVIWNRSDNQMNRLNNAELKIYRDDILVDTKNLGDMGDTRKKEFNYSGIIGNIVKVQLPGKNYLHLSEVQVFGSLQ